VYKVSEAYWNQKMIDDATAYQDNRKKNKKSDYEKTNLPESFEKLKKAITTYKKTIQLDFDSPATLTNLYKLQWWVILKLAIELPFRNDLVTLNVKEKKGNHILKQGKHYKIKIVHFKNSNRLGPREVTLSRKNSTMLKRFLAYRDKCGIKHDMLFSLRSGGKMTKTAFSQGLIGLTSRLLGKRIGTRIIRVLFATVNQDEIQKATEITNKLLHTSKQTLQYIRK
jgi:hypothetical protein